MTLTVLISRNSLRTAGKKHSLVSLTAWTHSKAESPTLREENEQLIKTVTRKKYRELPAVWKLLDGSNAPPLDEWLGGLDTPNRTPESALQHFESPERVDTLENEFQEPPRKRRRTKASRLADISSELTTRTETDAEKVRKRPSKKTDSKDEAAILVRRRRKSNKTPDNELNFTQSEREALLQNSPAATRKQTANVNLFSSVVEGTKQPEEDPFVKPQRAKRVQRIVSSTKENHQAGGRRRMPKNQLATEILENLAKFPHCILLTRVGNFYESYFDQAAEVARLLSIKLTKRTWDRQEVLMCGFPIVHLDRHLKALVQTHKRCVAMCEEFRRTNSEEGFDRRVVRVLTPGTLIDESFLNPYENNYLLAVGILEAGVALEQAPNDKDAHSDEPGAFLSCPLERAVGLAWIDVSTGEFFAQHSTVGGLKDDLTRIGPREVVLHPSLEGKQHHPIRLAVAEEGCYVSYISVPELSSPPSRTIDIASPVSHADDLVVLSSPSPECPTKPVFTEHETSAISLLTAFLQANLLDHMPLLSTPARQGQQDRMQIDSQTIKALEIKEGMREGGVTGSLLSVVKRTITSSGTRLLARWLCSPSTSVTEITARQNLVALFCSRHHLRDDLVQLLKRIEDASRIVQRFLLGKGDVEDLSAIKSAIELWEEIKTRIDMEHNMEAQECSGNSDDKWLDLKRMIERMADLRGLASRIGMAVDPATVKQHSSSSVEDHPGMESLASVNADSEVMPVNIMTTRGTRTIKWAIKSDFSPEIAALHAGLAEAESTRQRLEQDLQRRYDAPSLTLRSTGNHGTHVHIGKSRRDLVKIERSPHFIPIASTSTTKSFFNQTWYLLGTRIIETMTQIWAAERNAFETLRGEVNIQAGALRRNARIIDELDVTLGFATLACEMNFVRPIVNDSSSYLVTNGRHPSVELGLLTSGRVFTPNSVSLTPESRLHIITGPNMAGKSTLLRQTAVLAVLAQTGSFVPADKAEIGVVDKMFSRVGAKDDLFRDRSTFMVEMLETSEILNRATDKSLVIMDEVGRGTTVKDGLAIAFATVHHLYNVNCCRGLFATHFHEVADMLGYIEGSTPRGFFKDINFFCTDIDETEDGHFAYSHRLRPGVNRDSHGLKVARLGGMPSSAMRVANDALDWMKERPGSWVADQKQLRAAGEALVTRKNQHNQESPHS